MSKKETSNKTLADAGPKAVDARPLFSEEVLSEFGPGLRIRRLQPEQIVAVRQRLTGVDIDKVSDSPVVEREAVRVVQASIVDHVNSLAFPGKPGGRQLRAMNPKRLAALAKQVVKFNEVS